MVFVDAAMPDPLTEMELLAASSPERLYSPSLLVVALRREFASDTSTPSIGTGPADVAAKTRPDKV